MQILFLRRRGQRGFGGPLMYHEFEQAVSKIADCKHAGRGWPLYRPMETVDQTVKRIYQGDPPDWVMDRERNEVQLTQRGYKVGAYTGDIHRRMWLKESPRDARDNIKRLNELNYDAFFMKVQYLHNPLFGADHVTPDIFMRRLKAKKYLLPYSVNPEIYIPNNDKDGGIALIGCSSSTSVIYPLRAKMEEHLPDFCHARGIPLLMNTSPPIKSAWNVREHEGKPQYLVRGRYAKTLGRVSFFLFCSSRFRYPVQKYFEGMSSGCVCFADAPSHAEELGFIDGKTYVEVNEGNWMSKLDYYLENPDEANKIARNARKLILDRHTHDIRAQEFIKMLTEFN